MRRLVWIGILFAALWTGWWFFASNSLQAGLQAWLAERRAAGWQADVSNTQSGGFPLALETTLVNPMLADPTSGLAFSASALQINAPVWWPGHVTVMLPEDEMVLASPLVRQSIQAQGAQADLRLHPGTTLQVQQMALTSGPWLHRVPEGSLMAGGGLTLEMLQAQDRTNRYAFKLDAPQFQPGSLPRAALRLPDDWPLTFDSLTLDMDVTFDRPFDRSTIEEARPQPRRIDLALAEAQWGRLSLRSAAALDVDPSGVLSGQFSLQARNWQDILTLSESAGVLPSGMRPQLENILGALARGSGNPDTIDVELTLRDGTMFMGFIPLGRAPRVVLR
jgi:hypothetical protein